MEHTNIIQSKTQRFINFMIDPQNGINIVIAIILALFIIAKIFGIEDELSLYILILILFFPLGVLASFLYKIFLRKK